MLPAVILNTNEHICVTEHNKRNVSLQNQRCVLNTINVWKEEMNPRYTRNTKNETQVHKSMMVCKHKENKSHVNDVDLALRFDLDRRVPIYVDKTNLNKTIQKFTISNYNNKYNIYYKKRLFLPSIRSLNRTVKYNEWQKIFIQSLRDKQREEMELKYKMKQMRIIEKGKIRRKKDVVN